MRKVTCLTLAILVTWAAPVRADEPSKVLESMKQELDRNMAKLSLPDYPSPYYISYLMRDAHTRGVSARFGASVLERDDRDRIVFTDLRVGSPQLDNTLDPFPGFDMLFPYNPLAAKAPLDFDDLALRKTLWKITDQEYKKAVSSYLKVKAEQVYKRADPDFSGCFTPAPVNSHVDKTAKFIEDFEAYEKVVLKLSDGLAKHTFVVDSSVSFDVTKQDRYFVSSEGSTVYTSTMYYSYSVQLFARADDGTVVPHAFVLYARSEKELPGYKELNKRVTQLADELSALRMAKGMQPYSGPALLEGDTSGVFLHEALGHRLEGHRQSGRNEGGTFSGKVGDKILPDHIDVYDDPTVRELDGTGLNGYYLYDDEGVLAGKATLVEAGKLAGFLLTRRPVEKFRKSNGHARASTSQRPVARMGTLVLDSRERVPAGELKQRLLEMARKQGKPYAIILRRASSGATNTSSWGFQAFKGVARLVYRVDAKTGEETLVRGVELVGTPLASLMKIAVVGDDQAVFNGYCGAESGFIPVSTITPSLILSELELQKAPPRRERKEVIPPPE